MLADAVDHVIGVDTHRDRHALALIEAATVRTRACFEIEANRSGYRHALRLVRRHARGRRAWAVEGTGSYGKRLSEALLAAGELVLEVERPARLGKKGRAKSDPLDAERAARALLGEQGGTAPRQGRDALRALLVAREGAVRAATQAVNELRALLLTAPEELGGSLARASEARLLRRCLALRPQAHADPEQRGIALALRSLALRLRTLRREAQALTNELDRRTAAASPNLRAQYGVGPVSAGIVLCAWSQRRRLRSEGAFARLAGTAPLPASSGLVVRHRLDRGGDRRLNRALHPIVLCRSGTTPAPAPTSPAVLPRASQNGRQCAASSATSPARSSVS
jgi:transposase